MVLATTKPRLPGDVNGECELQSMAARLEALSRPWFWIWIWKILQFANENPGLGPVLFLTTSIIRNVHEVIMIFWDFFGSPPLPTATFCRNMAKICELHSPHKFRFWRPVIQLKDMRRELRQLTRMREVGAFLRWLLLGTGLVSRGYQAADMSARRAVPEAGAPEKMPSCKWLEFKGRRALSGFVGPLNLKNYERPDGRADQQFFRVAPVYPGKSAGIRP